MAKPKKSQRKQKRIFHKEPAKSGSQMRDIVLGMQDGLVNVLGVVLAIAAATVDTKIVLIGGLAAMFAESVSMAAVAYTSTKAERDYYNKMLKTEQREMEDIPEAERKEIRDIYYKKGLRGRQLDTIVRTITSSKKTWLSTMMTEELGLSREKSSPVKSAAIVGISAIIGSVFPILPFLFLVPATGIISSLILSVAVLFALGVLKAKLTVGNWLKSGAEIAAIGMAAALIGYGLGAALGVVV